MVFSFFAELYNIGGVVMILRNALSPYCESLIRGIEAENWHLALMAACTLPDICTSLEGKKFGDDYVEWFDTYVQQYKQTLHRRKGLKNATTLAEYQELMKQPFGLKDVESFELIVFTGVNAYALRCGFLHNGDGELFTQAIYKKPKHKDALLGIEKVKFDTDLKLIFRQDDNIGYLNPKIYCEAILAGVEKWIINEEHNSEVLQRAANLISFE